MSKKTSKPKTATVGEKIVCKVYGMKLVDVRESSAESGFRRHASIIDYAIKRAVKDVCMRMARYAHEINEGCDGNPAKVRESIERKYGVRL